MEFLQALDLPYKIAIGGLVWYMILRWFGGALWLIFEDSMSYRFEHWAKIFLGVTVFLSYGTWAYAGGYFFYKLF